MGDPALDTKEMKVRGPGGYGETRDPALVRSLPGRDPVWFELRELTPRDSIFVDERGTPLRAARAAVSLGLVSATLPNGTTLLPKVIAPTLDGNRPVWDDEGLDDLVRRFGKAAIQDIGSAIMEVDARAGEAFASADGLRFTLLPSSLAALEANERRRAELDKATTQS